MQTRRSVLASSLGLLALTLSRHTHAQAWPQKPVLIIVPFAPGGNTDGAARTIALRLSEVFGQQFVVENRPGASGAIAAEAAARASADGYTLFMATPTQIAIVPAVTKVRYDPLRSFAPISNIGTNPFVLTVHQSVPAKTLAEFVTRVRARPSEMSYASVGPASLRHLSMVLFLRRGDLQMTPVHYKGGLGPMTDVIAGHVPAIFANLSDVLPQVASGFIRPLAVSSNKRMPQIPDVPTFSEAGYPGFEARTWNGLVAPVGTPADIVDRLAAEIARVAKDPKVIERFTTFGVELLGNSPKEFGEIMAADIAFWARAMKIADAGSQK